MILYQVLRYRNVINRVEALKVTDKTLTRANGRREHLESDYVKTFRTYEEALAYLIDRQEDILASLEERLRAAKSEYDDILKMPKHETENANV